MKGSHWSRWGGLEELVCLGDFRCFQKTRRPWGRGGWRCEQEPDLRAACGREAADFVLPGKQSVVKLGHDMVRHHFTKIL